MQETQNQQKPNGWMIVDKFAEQLKDNEKTVVFMFIMIVFFYLAGFVSGTMFGKILFG